LIEHSYLQEGFLFNINNELGFFNRKNILAKFCVLRLVSSYPISILKLKK